MNEGVARARQAVAHTIQEALAESSCGNDPVWPAVGTDPSALAAIRATELHLDALRQGAADAVLEHQADALAVMASRLARGERLRPSECTGSGRPGSTRLAAGIAVAALMAMGVLSVVALFFVLRVGWAIFEFVRGYLTVLGA